MFERCEYCGSEYCLWGNCVASRRATAPVCTLALDQALARVIELEAALQKYGQHDKKNCGRFRWSQHAVDNFVPGYMETNEPCTCGFDAALDNSKPTR